MTNIYRRLTRWYNTSRIKLIPLFARDLIVGVARAAGRQIYIYFWLWTLFAGAR